MAEQVRLLQAEIRSSIEAIEEVYRQIEGAGEQATGSSQDIIIAYYLHVLYGLFENLFEQIAQTFGHHITGDKSRWRSRLLKRMTLEVKPIRPAVIGQESYICLNELRAFRHLFRNAYLLQFDPERLNIVIRHANRLKSLYRIDLDKFLDFLEQLAQT